MSDLREVVLAELARGTHTEAFADGARWAVQEAEKLAPRPVVDREAIADPRAAKAWDEARLEAFRTLMARAAEHERLAAMGAQDTERVRRWLVENDHPSYAQQAIAERALADQVAGLEVPSELMT